MGSARAPRNTLTREKLIAAALELVDHDGLGALTIRELANRLGVRPMAIYHYTASKEHLLDTLVDVVFDEVHLPRANGEWRDELRLRATSVRDTLERHRWALPVMETRVHPGPATLANHEAVLALLRGSGFSLQAAAHAYAITDAFVYGFALQEAMLDVAGVTDSAAPVAAAMNLTSYPRVAELAEAYAGPDPMSFRASFEVGLEVVLDGLERIAASYPEDGPSTSPAS